MAKIAEFLEVALDDLEVGKGQARTRQVADGIAELADSIARQGLIEPIVVCPGSQPGKYEIITGQRRYLAHRELGRPSIWAVVLDSKVDEIRAKVISVTENLVRRDLVSQDLIDACTYLYYKYGSLKAVAEETGLPYEAVRTYTKFDQLVPEMKELVKKGEVRLKTALRAQAAAEEMADDDDVAKSAVVLAKEMSQMTGAQQRRLHRKIQETPEGVIDDVIENAKKGSRVTEVVVTLGEELHQRLRQFADDEGTTHDDAAVSLIDEGLVTKGYVN